MDDHLALLPLEVCAGVPGEFDVRKYCGTIQGVVSLVQYVGRPLNEQLRNLSTQIEALEWHFQQLDVQP